MVGALALAVTDRLHERLVAADERGLSATAALIHMRLRPGENIDFLARLLDISHSAAVRLVDRLEADGLVERRRGRDDARARTLELTRDGRRAAVAALNARLDLLEDVLAPLAASERRQLEPLVEKVLAALVEDRWDTRHTCRLCDYATCDAPYCPVDRAVDDPGVGVARLPPAR
jgi:MarR family transcriptional regulator, negative regulator of the multidrug operon emrRAB